MTASSRRGFLKMRRQQPPRRLLSAGFRPGPIRRRFQGRCRSGAPFATGGMRRRSLAWKPVTEVAPDAIALDPAATNQEILGFGAALTMRRAICSASFKTTSARP